MKALLKCYFGHIAVKLVWEQYDDSQHFIVNHGAFGPPRPVMSQKVHSLTTKEPRSRDSRFLHTGRRISMQLKLRTAAGALAQGKPDWNTTHTHRKAVEECNYMVLEYFHSMFYLYMIVFYTSLQFRGFSSYIYLSAVAITVGFPFDISDVCKLLIVPPRRDFHHGFI